MKFKCKISKHAGLTEIKNELDRLKEIKLSVIQLNCIRKFTSLLGCKEIPGKGSSIRFRHEFLVDEPYYTDGIFQVHKIHKGGNKEEIRKSDFVKYIYPHLIKIIEKQIKINKDVK